MSERNGGARRDELETLLPFYLNGTLEGEESRRVEEWLTSDDPEAAAALAQAEAEFAATLEANEALRPPPDALSRFSAALEREAGPERRPAQAGLAARLWQGLVGLPAGVAWAVAGLAVAILLAQTLTDRTGEPGGYEIAGEESLAANRPFVLVTFDPAAPIGEITATLSGLGVAIAEGPLPGGMYRVVVPAEDSTEFDRISAGIAASDLVVEVVIGRRPADG